MTKVSASVLEKIQEAKERRTDVLDLRGEELTEIPSEVFDLKHLTTLDLSLNKIKEVPNKISLLQNLTTLVLSFNELKVLPEAVVQLGNLHSLWAGHNPFVTPPPEVVERGIGAIKGYYRQLKAGEDYLYEAKLLIIGEPGAGKTSLANKIADPYYQLQDEKSTEGIDVLQWTFPLDFDSERDFRVNIWDFGGQEIYHTTHQFFLTKRSLYVLVADTRKEDTDFYYWLNVIELLSDNSPVLIVKNEKQERHREINERQLRGQFANLKEILPTNLATNRGLEKIQDYAKHYIKNLPHIGSPLPKTWVRVRENLETDSRNHLSLDEYLIICRSNGFDDVRSSLQLSEYLHDLGVFLHFQDDSLLKKTVILKPKWGTDAVYKVLDNKSVIRNLGKFTDSDLKLIWSEPEYSTMQDELLRLMMKFKLCYEIPNISGTYIAPQLLTENQPEYSWDSEAGNRLLLRYTYEFMPKGILTQFIVVMHQYILEQKYVWKSGVILEKGKTKAEVIEIYDKREIHVKVVGAHKKEFMSIIMYELDKIHGSYKKLKYDKLIPCNCIECQNNQEPHFYKLDRLQKFIDDFQKDIQCQQSYKMVNVIELINDVMETRNYDGGKPMSKSPQIHVSIGSNSKVGDIVIDSTIRNNKNTISSAEISPELKETLNLFVNAIEEMTKTLSNNKASDVTDSLNSVVNEATTDSPNPGKYLPSIEGLIKAAENVGKVGKPVIEIAGKLITLLMIKGG